MGKRARAGGWKPSILLVSELRRQQLQLAKAVKLRQAGALPQRYGSVLGATEIGFPHV